ncbi:MAG: Crp/Fnr family transcriptional regulator [Chloroflexota bacterium]|nr:Crp/Fnr family transcriptional regulator [Chloroflexota bacterium]
MTLCGREYLSDMNNVELLAQVPLFASANGEDLAELACRMSQRTYRRGEGIFRQGDPGSTLFIIQSGQVKISASSAEGEEAVFAILSEKDFFGELSLFDGKPRSASAVALTVTRTLLLCRADFVEVISKCPELAMNVLSALSTRLRRADLLVEDAVFLDLPTRLAKRLLELGECHGLRTEKGLEIELCLTQQDLADVVGVSRVAVNKQLSVYQDGGIIHLSRQRITLLRPEQLRNYL